MARLTFVAYRARQMIKYGGMGLVGLVLIWVVGSAGIKAYRRANPKKVPPTMKYGLLPKIVFPEREVETKNFKAELANDAFPEFPDQAKVYVIYRPDTTFLALEEDKETAGGMGFSTEAREIKAGVYEFKNDNLNQTLTMNVLEGSFMMKYPYETDQIVLNPERMPNKDEAISSAESFLQSAERLSVDLREGEKEVSYWKVEGGSLTPVNSSSEANMARVDFYRQELSTGVGMVSDVAGQAPVSVLVSGAAVGGKKIVEVNYKNLNMDRESFSTYPIKTANQAWSDLSAGNYWPVSDVKEKEVAIRQMRLAYFEPVTLTNFLQPVFVFEGDNNFVAYVTAIKDDKIKK